jgi:hypothetical protein
MLSQASLRPGSKPIHVVIFKVVFAEAADAPETTDEATAAPLTTVDPIKNPRRSVFMLPTRLESEEVTELPVLIFRVIHFLQLVSTTSPLL